MLLPPETFTTLPTAIEENDCPEPRGGGLDWAKAQPHRVSPHNPPGSPLREFDANALPSPCTSCSLLQHGSAQSFKPMRPQLPRI